MFFVIREIAGWLLVGVGLLLIRFVFSYLNTRQVVEAGIVTMSAIAFFRGGIHLVRISTAARICRHDTTDTSTTN